METLSARRESAVVKLFSEIKNEGHVLHNLLPVRLHNAGVSVRTFYPYVIPKAKTSRKLSSLISYCISRRLFFFPSLAWMLSVILIWSAFVCII